MQHHSAYIYFDRIAQYDGANYYICDSIPLWNFKLRIKVYSDSKYANYAVLCVYALRVQRLT